MTSFEASTPNNLARNFCAALRESLTVGQMIVVVDRNRAETSKGVCHSHDFCDANMVMLAAWEDTYGGEPPFMDDSEEQRSVSHWNAAWDLAKAAEFDAAKITD